MVKLNCVKLLVQILKISNYDLRNLMSEHIILNFGKSESYATRCAYIDFCIETKHYCSRSLFKTTYFSNLLDLSIDPIKDVRIKFLTEFPLLRERISSNDISASNDIDLVLEKMHNDKELIIRNMAEEVQTIMTNDNYWRNVNCSENLLRDRLMSYSENDLKNEAMNKTKEEGKIMRNPKKASTYTPKIAPIIKSFSNSQTMSKTNLNNKDTLSSPRSTIGNIFYKPNKRSSLDEKLGSPTNSSFRTSLERLRKHQK